LIFFQNKGAAPLSMSLKKHQTSQPAHHRNQILYIFAITCSKETILTLHGDGCLLPCKFSILLRRSYRKDTSSKPIHMRINHFVTQGRKAMFGPNLRCHMRKWNLHLLQFW